MGFLNRIFPGKTSQPKPIENPALLKAMDAVALHDTAETRDSLYRAMLAATFIIPTPELPPNIRPGVNVADGNMQIQIAGTVDGNGKKVTTVFTDDEALKNWDPNTPSIALQARAYFQMIVGLDFDEVVVNPFDPIRKMIRPGGRVTRREFTELAAGRLPLHRSGPTKIPAGTQMMFGSPKSPPPAKVLEALKAVLEKHEEVEAAYLLMLALGGENQPPPHMALGLKLRNPVNPAHYRMFDELAAIVRQSLKGSEPFDIMPLQSGMLAEVERTIRPLFKRN